MHSSVALTRLTDLCRHLHSQFCNGLTLQKNHTPPILPNSLQCLVTADGLCDRVCLLWTFYIVGNTCCVAVWLCPLSVTLMLYNMAEHVDTPFLSLLADSLLHSLATV